MRHGALAQLGERLLCKHQVVGSIPTSSTTAHVRRVTSRRQAVTGKARDRRRNAGAMRRGGRACRHAI
jgi:hypothetical protein